MASPVRKYTGQAGQEFEGTIACLTVEQESRGMAESLPKATEPCACSICLPFGQD
jgi:hypothetical protein